MDKKITLITGASRGIGKATAILLAKNGYFPILLARNEIQLKAAVSEIQAMNLEGTYYDLDITNEDAVKKTVNAIIAQYGRIDVLVNNAGIGYFKEMETITTTEWDQVMDVNVKGTFLLTKAIVPLFKNQQSGHIVNIASDVSRRTFPNGSLYCASKYAMDAFTSSIRKELRVHNVKVSQIMPGLVRTTFDGDVTEVDRKKEWLDAEDIANAVLYILQTPSSVVIDEVMIHPMCQEY